MRWAWMNSVVVRGLGVAAVGFCLVGLHPGEVEAIPDDPTPIGGGIVEQGNPWDDELPARYAAVGRSELNAQVGLAPQTDRDESTVRAFLLWYLVVALQRLAVVIP